MGEDRNWIVQPDPADREPVERIGVARFGRPRKMDFGEFRAPALLDEHRWLDIQNNWRVVFLDDEPWPVGFASRKQLHRYRLRKGAEVRLAVDPDSGAVHSIAPLDPRTPAQKRRALRIELWLRRHRAQTKEGTLAAVARPCQYHFAEFDQMPPLNWQRRAHTQRRYAVVFFVEQPNIVQGVVARSGVAAVLTSLDRTVSITVDSETGWIYSLKPRSILARWWDRLR